MKIKQLFLLGILLCTSTTLPMSAARAQFFKWAPRIARTTAFVGGCGLPTYEYAKNAYDSKKLVDDPEYRNSWFKKQVQVTKYYIDTGETISVESAYKYLDAPEIVTNYVEKKLQEHYSNPAEGISIRIMVDQFGTDGKDNVTAIVNLKGPIGIAFGPQRIKEFAEALEVTNQSNVDDITMAKAQAIVALNDATLNHEIGHLKDHYVRYTQYYQTTIPLVTYASLQLIKAASQKILRTPTNMAGLVVSCMAILPSIYTQRFINENLWTAYSRMVENTADDYACQTTKDPASLRSFANLLENDGIEYYKTWVNLSADMEGDLKNYTKLPLHTKAMIQAIYFRNSPTHPIWFKRTAKLRKAALALEEQQKNQEKN